MVSLNMELIRNERHSDLLEVGLTHKVSREAARYISKLKEALAHAIQDKVLHRQAIEQKNRDIGKLRDEIAVLTRSSAYAIKPEWLIPTRELYEQYQARQVGVPYDELKSQFDLWERQFKIRYGMGSGYEKDWIVWQAAFSCIQMAHDLPIPYQSVLQAIQAIDDEASRRGEMFPQTADEQREDRSASRRVIEMIKWYALHGGMVAHKLKDWPKFSSNQKNV